MDNDSALLEILRRSHEQALNGQTYSTDEVELFMKQKLYEITDEVDAGCAAEPL